jgi:hypothetical protein
MYICMYVCMYIHCLFRSRIAWYGDKSLTGEPILPARPANQYLARYWFAVRAGKIGSPVKDLSVGSIFSVGKFIHVFLKLYFSPRSRVARWYPASNEIFFLIFLFLPAQCRYPASNEIFFLIFLFFSQVLGPACVQGRLVSQRKRPSNEKKICNKKIFFLQVLGQACMQIGSGLVHLQSQMKVSSRRRRMRRRKPACK